MFRLWTCHDTYARFRAREENRMKKGCIRGMIRRITAGLTAAVLAVAGAVVPPAGIITSYAAPETVVPADLGVDELSYELKFLLDSSQVLDDNYQLKEEWKTAFGISGKPGEGEVMYLETEDRDFESEGWFNRLRRRSWKDNKPQLTYKKRYAVSGMDIAAALEEAKADGLPDAAGTFEAEVDWGYKEMKLSFNVNLGRKKIGDISLPDITEEEARQLLKEKMPALEKDWKDTGWGTEAAGRVLKAGPLKYTRFEGTYLGKDVKLEIWPVKGADGDEDSYIVELSYESAETDTFADVAAVKTAITEALDNEKILLHEDSLKTKRILDAWIPRKEKPGITVRFFAMEGDAEPIYQAGDTADGKHRPLCRLADD